jgi:EmrB/QacA subfamily drug resistance transporter
MATVTLNSPAGRWTLISAILASSMAFIDGTALNVVLPALQKSLNAAGADLFWILNAYLLVLASLLLIGGALGDRLGRKKVFMTGIVIFIVGSAACGFAPDVNYLIAFRIVQGFGGALMIPGSLSLISSSIDDKEKGKAIGTWSAATTMVTVGGPILGGALADAGLWRYIFFINFPIGIIALVILWQKVAESRDPDFDSKLDLPGAIAIALGLAALTFGFLRAPALGFGDWQVWGALAAGVALFMAFLVIEHVSRHPMMPLKLFANRTFSGVNLQTFLLYAGLAAGMLFISLDLVQAQGYSQFQSGLTFLPFTFLMITITRRAGALADRYGPRMFLVGGPALAGLGLLMLSFVGETRGPDDYWTTFLPGFLVFGLGMAFTVSPLTTTVMTSVSDEFSGTASGINNAVSRVSNVFANAIFGALAVVLFTGALHQRLDGMASMPQPTRQEVIAQASNLGDAKVPPAVSGDERAVVTKAYRDGFIDAYQQVVKIAAGLAFAAAVVGLIFVRKNRGYPQQ